MSKPLTRRRVLSRRLTFMIRGLRERLRNRAFRAEIAQLSALRDSRSGQTLVVIGNGPSVNRMDLRSLLRSGLPIMTVNKGFEIPALAGHRVDYHCISDINCYRTFGPAIDAAPVGQRFYRTSFIELVPAAVRAASEIYFVPSRRGGILKRGFDARLERGLGSDSTVLVFGAFIALHLGFETVAVIGCDLDYAGPQAYAYAMTAADLDHEADPKTQERRQSLVNTNAEFALLREQYERRGRRLVNAGLGGRLTTLPRVTLAEIAGGPAEPVKSPANDRAGLYRPGR